MTTGYLAAGHCWETTAEAIDAYYSHLAPNAVSQFVTASNSNILVMTYVKDSGVWKLNRNVNGSSNTIQNAMPTNVYGSCTLEDTSMYDFSPEAFELGFLGICMLWVIGISIGLILGQLRKLRTP